jgi:hypothetical protein
MESAEHSNRESNCNIALGQGRKEMLPATFLLALEAYLSLIRFDFSLVRGNFEAIYNKVRNYATGKKTTSPDAVEPICAAVDMACIWYCKEVLCLQRSVVAACLLRKYGVSAHLVIGAQQMPFKAHAWVEVDGKVVNDKQYVPEMYEILTRC